MHNQLKMFKHVCFLSLIGSIAFSKKKHPVPRARGTVALESPYSSDNPFYWVSATPPTAEAMAKSTEGNDEQVEGEAFKCPRMHAWANGRATSNMLDVNSDYCATELVRVGNIDTTAAAGHRQWEGFEENQRVRTRAYWDTENQKRWEQRGEACGRPDEQSSDDEPVRETSPDGTLQIRFGWHGSRYNWNKAGQRQSSHTPLGIGSFSGSSSRLGVLQGQPHRKMPRKKPEPEVSPEQNPNEVDEADDKDEVHKEKMSESRLVDSS